MIYYKTKEEIALLRQGGKILGGILDKICSSVCPEKSTLELENLAIELIENAGGRPSFRDYDMGGGLFFPSALCVSINNEVVHGASLPERFLKSGDIVGLDIGMEWPLQTKDRARLDNRPFNIHSEGGGFYTDTCRTVAVGKISSEAKKILKITKDSLNVGISKAVAGNSLADIGRAIEKFVKRNGFSVVRDLVGHGLGYFAHEDPYVFNYEIDENDFENVILKPGMVIAIEPMVNMGKFNVKMSKNGYTAITSDKSLSAHFEHSIAILEKGNLVLTEF